MTKQKISKTVVHKLIGHANDQVANEVLEYLEYELEGEEPDPCNICRESKARKEAIPKDSDKDISIGHNQLIWLDMSTLRKPKNCEDVDKITISN